MHKYLVLKILDSRSVSLPSTQVYGVVEFRSHKSDSESEASALKKSAVDNRSNFDQYSLCARIATIIDAGSMAEATELSENIFSEVLDLKSVEFAISNFKISDIGFVKDLESGEIKPINKFQNEPSMSFMVQQGDTQRIDFVNYILSLKNELGERYQRSLHWVRNSKHEKNIQIKTLFYWFAIEALLKESEIDNIEGIVRWFLGFPNGRHRNVVSSSLLTSLANHSRYSYWNRKIIDVLDKVRVFRNDSVHSGFRSVDFSKKELELYSQVMVYATSRCHAAVQIALISRISTVSEFKEYMPAIFENNNNIINDVHGNILFTLDRIERA
ncbi:MAG: hypothetical protein U0998_05990 [Moraxellaceae bacterium]|nr:hypothetical protein [Moraxellaceae bacterium]MDZ4386758.1 hypothetical protein [Moraxellaceae bacterium]